MMTTLNGVFGLPPFYVPPVAAGALRVDFGRFLVAAVAIDRTIAWLSRRHEAHENHEEGTRTSLSMQRSPTQSDLGQR